jgi:uncharacterized membrane protein
MKAILLESIYIIAGCISLMTAFYALKDKNHPSRIGTAMFWGIIGAIFVIGKYVPAEVIGALLVLMAILTAMKKVNFGSQENAPEKEREASSQKIGNKIFIPALTIGIVAFIFGSGIKSLGGLVGLGAGAILATIIALNMTKTEAKYIGYDGSRLLQQIGSASILPQLLTALGALFAAAGVGEVIATGVGSVIVEGNILIAVIAYCLGMAIFTMIMGNAFAAFAVITAGIGVPFVISQGANPAIAGILALTAGYCGTLMTPMAANFNIVPAALLETKNKNRVIIAQVPFALTLLVVHIILMYTLAF